MWLLLMREGQGEARAIVLCCVGWRQKVTRGPREGAETEQQEMKLYVMSLTVHNSSLFLYAVGQQQRKGWWL